MNAIEHLESHKWNHPESYVGHSPIGDYVIYSRNRDSSILENVNYDCILEELLALNEQLQGDDDEPFVYDFRANHWACGWVEYIIVDKNAPEAILQAAGEIVCALEGYPVYNEDKYSEACYNAIYEEWENASIRERINLIKEYCDDANIFAARHDTIPEDVYNGLSEVYY